MFPPKQPTQLIRNAYNFGFTISYPIFSKSNMEQPDPSSHTLLSLFITITNHFLMLNHTTYYEFEQRWIYFIK